MAEEMTGNALGGSLKNVLSSVWWHGVFGSPSYSSEKNKASNIMYSLKIFKGKDM